MVVRGGSVGRRGGHRALMQRLHGRAPDSRGVRKGASAMADPNLNAVNLEWQARAREVADKYVRPVAWKYDRLQEYPFEVCDRMKEYDLFKVFVPTEYGGAGSPTPGTSLPTRLPTRARSRPKPFPPRRSAIGPPFMCPMPRRSRRAVTASTPRAPGRGRCWRCRCWMGAEQLAPS